MNGMIQSSAKNFYAIPSLRYLLVFGRSWCDAVYTFQSETGKSHPFAALVYLDVQNNWLQSNSRDRAFRVHCNVV